MTEQVSGLPSTARAASAEAKVEDWSAGLRRATLAWKSVECKRYPSLLCSLLVTGAGNNFRYFVDLCDQREIMVFSGQ